LAAFFSRRTKIRLRKFVKAFAWLHERQRVTDEDVLEVVP